MDSLANAASWSGSVNTCRLPNDTSVARFLTWQVANDGLVRGCSLQRPLICVI